MGRMRVFISSTSDLQAERDAAEELLACLEMEGERFEAWPSSPNAPMSECLQRIDESHAVIFILGARYGSVLESGSSATHTEYRHALATAKPVFVYILSGQGTVDPQQIGFIEEVRQRHFHGRRVDDVQELKDSIRKSLLLELQRCFIMQHSLPPRLVGRVKTPLPPTPPIGLPDTIEATMALLQKLYANRDDAGIHALAPLCELRYGQSVEVMNMVYAAEVNLGINGYDADRQRLNRAIAFWTRIKPKAAETRIAVDYNCANALLALEQYPEAATAYRAVLVNKPNHAQAWKNLGHALLEMGDQAAGKKALKTALHHQPQLFEAQYSLATLAITQDDDFRTALSYLDAIDLSGVTSHWAATVHAWKAEAFLRLDQLEDGIADAEEAIAAEPEALWAWSVAARLYSAIRRRDNTWLVPASQFWERFLSRHPNVHSAWAELGFVYWFLWQQRPETELAQRATAAFTRATELGYEDDGLVWDRIGHLHQKQERWEEAVDAFREAVARSPKQFGCCLGVGLLRVGQFGSALPYLLAAAERHQPDAMSWCHVGECYDKLDRPDDAEGAYRKALEIDREWPDAWFNLGGFYWNRRRIPEALETWRMAKQKFPQDKHCQQVQELLDLSGLSL